MTDGRLTMTQYGVLEAVSPLVRRVFARNPSPFTHTGTGTFIVGHGSVAVIDPGPSHPDHAAAILAGLGDEVVSHIIVTHTHMDHSPASRLLQAATGAPIYAAGPHGMGVPERRAENQGADLEFTPDVTIWDGAIIEGKGWRLEAVHTPGHASNHLCYALPSESTLFSGDHVMGWSTTVIIPPDGNMAAYLASLRYLLTRNEALYRPTHGPAITDPRKRLRALIAGRERRSAEILEKLTRGRQTVQSLTDIIYPDAAALPNPRAAKHTVLAHLLLLIEDGLVESSGGPEREMCFWRR